MLRIIHMYMIIYIYIYPLSFSFKKALRNLLLLINPEFLFLMPLWYFLLIRNFFPRSHAIHTTHFDIIYFHRLFNRSISIISFQRLKISNVNDTVIILVIYLLCIAFTFCFILLFIFDLYFVSLFKPLIKFYFILCVK